MKKMLAMFLAALMCATLLAGCGGQKTEPDSGTEKPATEQASQDEGAKYKFAWCNNSAADAYQVALTNEFEKNKDALGIELVTFDAQGSTETQATQVGQALAQGVDAILITANDAVGLGPALKEAVDNGVVVITVAADLSEELAANRTSYVGCDDTIAGTVAGEAFKAYFPDGAKVVQIEGQAGYSAQIRRADGFAKALEGSNIEVIDSQACSAWDPSEAMNIAEDFIVKYGDEIEGIFVHWDNGATGVVEALEASSLDLDKLFIASVDGCSNGVNLVKSGKTDLCIMQDLSGIAYTAMETAIQALNGEAVESIINPPLVEVTSENCNDYNPSW